MPGSDEIGKREIRGIALARNLLTQSVEGGEFFFRDLIRVQNESSPSDPAGQKPITARRQPFLLDDALKHRLGVGEQRARRLTRFLVVEDAGIRPFISQAWKKATSRYRARVRQDHSLEARAEERGAAGS